MYATVRGGLTAVVLRWCLLAAAVYLAGTERALVQATWEQREVGA